MFVAAKDAVRSFCIKPFLFQNYPWGYVPRVGLLGPRENQLRLSNQFQISFQRVSCDYLSSKYMLLILKEKLSVL